MTHNLSIAVLPFQNMSSDQENEYFCDGITEEIINALAKIESLKVTSRTSSFHFKNTKQPIPQIGKELNVANVLEGSVRLSGNTLRITAQLIQVAGDYHYWSETWDRKLENVFEIQDEVSLLIADKIRENFGHFEIQDQLVNQQTDNLEAYEFSLKAKFYANKWNPEEMRKAIVLYEKALELDPNHTGSLVGLADAYSFMAMTGFMSFEEAWTKSSELTRKALSISDQSHGAYYQLANLAFFTACDFNESLKQATKAIELKPNYVEAQQFMSFLLIISGEKEKSRYHLDIALSIDPLSQETLFFSAYLDYMLENYEACLAQLDRCLEVNPKNIPAHGVKTICLLKLERYDEVITYFDDKPTDIVILGEKTGSLGLAYVLKNDTTQAELYLNQLKEQADGPNGFTADSYLFMMYAAMGDMDKAFEWVKNGIENKSSLLLLRYADPLVSSLKADPRYSVYQKQMFPSAEEVLPVKAKKALLDQETTAVSVDRLLNQMTADESFLNPDLSLRSLADQVKIHPNQLSWLLNEKMGKSFNEFVNQYRVEAFMRIAKNPKNAHLTLVSLAYESGFNSKTVFNTYFKKETGLTPKQFLKDSH